MSTERFVCSECGKIYPSLHKASKCHWGIAGVAGEFEDPELFAEYVADRD